MCTPGTMYYRLLICTHILHLLLHIPTPTNSVIYTQIYHTPHVDYILIPKHTNHFTKSSNIKFIQNDTQSDTTSTGTRPVIGDNKTTSPNDSTTIPSKTIKTNDSNNTNTNTDNAAKINANNEKNQSDTLNNSKSNEKSNTGSSSILGSIACVITAGTYCPNQNNDKNNESKNDNLKTNDDVKSNEIVPVESKNCFEYGKPGVVPSDWVKPEELGWIVVDELGINRFTSSKPANASYPPNLLLDKLECNAASYEVVLKLGSDSIGGLVFRASTDKEMAVVLNTSTKTITLSKNQNGGYQPLYEKSHQSINSQFLHKLGIIDSGYKGEVQILLDGNVIMNVPRLYFDTSGGFGLHIEKGNVSFSEASVEPL